MLSAAKSTGNWIDYWDSDTLFRPIMKSAARYFYAKARPVLRYDPRDVVLDFGCGPGYLAELLAESCREVHGVDTSARMIAECRARFAARPNMFFHRLDRDRYTDLSALGQGRFSLIVCLSVIQYFDSLASVELLLDSFRRAAAPGARLLVADIPVRGAPLRETFELLRASLTENILRETLWFLLRSVASRYSITRARAGLLVIPLRQLEELADRLSLEARFLTEPLTYNRHRLHMLVSCR
jgi:SAM-dependent methyltransferase